MVLKDCDSADLILVNSDFVKETLVRYGYQKSKVEVVYLGVREDFYSLKSEYKRSKTLNILFTGSFEIRKGAEYILKAMQVLDNCGFSYTLTVVGSNSEANDILKKFPIKYLNLVGHVPQDELVDYLSVADIYLFPSLAEGCAVSAMEAMAAGLPVIVTKESGVPVDDHINGLEVPSKDVQRIVDAIFELESDEELRKKIGSNAAKTIANNYSWDLYSEKVKGLYLDLVNSQEH